MNKSLFPLLLSLGFLSCQNEGVKTLYSIRGTVGFPGYEFPIEHFSVSLISGDQLIATSTALQFSFAGLEEGKPYLLIPQAEGDLKSGVSTLDMVQMDKYLKGELDLDDFQKIAADINKDNLINETDLELIQNCLVSDQCPAWRFASGDYNGSGAGYIDQYSVSKLHADHVVHFYPIKIGDISGTVRP